MEKASVLSTRIALMEFDRFNKAASKVKVREPMHNNEIMMFPTFYSRKYINFGYFQGFKVKEMFVRQLLQLKGLSLEKALAIVERYPTPLSLRKAFEIVGSDEGEKLLASIKVGSLSRQLGPALSKTVYQFYTKRILD